MKHIVFLACAICSAGAYVQSTSGAQEQGTQAGGSGTATSSEPKRGDAIPNVVGNYSGTFQNKISRLSPMGLVINIKVQRENGEISGELIQYAGTCSGLPMTLVGSIDANGRAQMQAVGPCPQKLDARISGNSITGDMEGRYPYEISLRK